MKHFPEKYIPYYIHFPPQGPRGSEVEEWSVNLEVQGSNPGWGRYLFFLIFFLKISKLELWFPQTYLRGANMLDVIGR